MALALGLYFVAVVALPLTMGLVISYRALPRDRACPLCGADTVPVQSALHRILRRLGSRLPLQRRWCVQCSWLGFARAPQPVLAPAHVLRSVRRPLRGCRTEPLRSLRFGGAEWRVLLQCWQEQGWTYGKLVFMGPAGRLWCDATHPFSGPERTDVVDQARALSDGLLTCRLKTLVSG